MPPDPRYIPSTIDSCALSPPDPGEEAATVEILAILSAGNISILLPHTVQAEISHPATPAKIKARAAEFVYTIETPLTPPEEKRLGEITAILQGNATPGRHDADAKHVFVATKYGTYFVTVDGRILKRRDALQRVSGAIILTPSQWLHTYRRHCAMYP